MRLILLFLFLLTHTLSSAQKTTVINDFKHRNPKFFVGLHKHIEIFDHKQIAQKFSHHSGGATIESIKISRLIIPENRYDPIEESNETEFYLICYHLNKKTGGPGTQLTNEKILVKNNSASVMTVNMRKYGIKLRDSVFFVGIEWIQNRKNMRYVQLGSENLEGGTDTGFLITLQSYQPFIGMVNTGIKTSNAWVYTKENNWQNYTRNLPEMTDLAISVSVK